MRTLTTGSRNGRCGQRLGNDVVGILEAEDRPVSQEVTEREHPRYREAEMSEKLPTGNNKSRFMLHYIFADFREESQDLCDKLTGILQKRFPDDAFVKIACPEVPDGWVWEPTTADYDLDIRPDMCPKTLFVGIGPGGLAAYQVQQDTRYRGISVFAACPPPGISSHPSGGPRAIVYGSKYGVYGIPTCLQWLRKKRGDIPTQLYALPSLIHGPRLALYCIAYLIGKYMNHEDLSQDIFTVTGDRQIHAAEGLE